MTVQKAPRFLSLKDIAQYSRQKGLALKEAVRSLLEEGGIPEIFRRNAGLISVQNQARLLDTPIFIAGAGGLGGEVAALLAQLGAGNLYLCDYDVFEESNTNRQRFCDSLTLGLPKAEITANALAKKIPWGDFKPVIHKLAPGDFPECFKNCAIVVDCLDSVAGKETLENEAMKAGIAWLHGSVLEYEGFACIKARPGGTLKSLYGSQIRESGAGSVLSCTVAGVASVMASLFIRWLNKPDYSSPLLHMDYSIPELERFSL